MSTRYEKRGASMRLESSGRGRNAITLHEGGLALEADGEFSCEPLPTGPALRLPSATSVPGAIDERIRKMARSLAVVERLTIVEGTAAHRFIAGSTRRRWEDTSGRLFVTLVRQPCGRRAALSLGSVSLEGIDLAPVSEVCDALALTEAPSPSRASSVTLEPWVAASLVRAVADERCELGNGLHLVQQPPAGARDGQGTAIRRRIVRPSSSEWPECFRPSYRFAPVFTPLHVDLSGPSDDGASFDYLAVALASRWVRNDATLTTRAWIVDRLSGTVSIGEIIVDPGAMNDSTVHSEGIALWFPEGAGAWGRRLTLRGPAARLRSP